MVSSSRTFEVTSRSGTCLSVCDRGVGTRWEYAGCVEVPSYAPAHRPARLRSGWRTGAARQGCILSSRPSPKSFRLSRPLFFFHLPFSILTSLLGTSIWMTNNNAQYPEPRRGDELAWHVCPADAAKSAATYPNEGHLAQLAISMISTAESFPGPTSGSKRFLSCC